MKKYCVLVAFLLLFSLMITGCGSKKTAPAAQESDPSLLTGTYNAELVIRDYGTVRFEMNADLAPITVTNFVKLAESGFYNGLTFHRIIDGFMMQGGDPSGNGTGGSSEKIKGEFSANGVKNDQSHTRGAVSMARANDMNSASSQFFIVHKDSTFLDGQYACFGYVTEGMDVVDSICTSVPVTDSNGSVARDAQPVIESISITH
ncbi:MAG: peptidylprolyl isomerase [Eubacteriales bacterium]|nr:peptidylprolyl isomerase [Eubacteriales bacterium]